MTQTGPKSLTKVLALASLFAFVMFTGGAGCSDSGKVVGNDDDTTSIDSVSFLNNIQPIFNANCAGSSCHIPRPEPTTQLSLKDYASVMAGSVNGPVIIPGIGKSSKLIGRLKGAPAPRMPLGRNPLSDAQIDLIGKWIDQGALNN